MDKIALVHGPFGIRDVTYILYPTWRDIKFGKDITAEIQSYESDPVRAIAYLSNCRLDQNASLINSFFGSLTVLKAGLSEPCQNIKGWWAFVGLLFNKKSAYSACCLNPGQTLKRIRQLARVETRQQTTLRIDQLMVSSKVTQNIRCLCIVSQAWYHIDIPCRRWFAN